VLHISGLRKIFKPSTKSTKKKQFGDAGNAGQGFTSHVIVVAAGEACVIQTSLFKYCLLILDFCIYLLQGKYSE